MKIERTLSIIKPNAVANNIIGNIISRFESAGLNIVNIKMLHLKKIEAKEFYAEHKNKLFFKNLIKFIISGPILVQILEGQNAININRKIIGATNPKYALPGTIRFDYAKNIIENSVHGSSSPESAFREINYFFGSDKIYKRNYLNN
ncbi:MAG: nucleoside-diphosphate kinase [Enterobacterales bacterium]